MGKRWLQARRTRKGEKDETSGILGATHDFMSSGLTICRPMTYWRNGCPNFAASCWRRKMICSERTGNPWCLAATATGNWTVLETTMENYPLEAVFGHLCHSVKQTCISCMFADKYVVFTYSINCALYMTHVLSLAMCAAFFRHSPSTGKPE